MAKPLKTAGADELAAFKRRVARQFAMERISGRDAQWLLDKVAEIEAYITGMREEGEEDWS